VVHEPPVERPDAQYPFQLTTGRRLEDFNTGVQTAAYRYPRRRGETLDLSPVDAERLGVRNGELVRVRSRRGEVVVPAYVDPSLRPGLVFMTFHFGEQAPTNVLTIDAYDPRSGTAEFKAAAVAIEKVAGG
jgi:formate dehydrogenase major subunit